MELGVASSRSVSSMSNLSVERQRMLLGAGAAAGVAAGFNAPIAGIFFALEIVKASVFLERRRTLALLTTGGIACLLAYCLLYTSPSPRD